MTEKYSSGEVRLLRTLAGEEYVVTHVGIGTEEPENFNGKTIVYKDPRQIVYHENGVALVPVINFFNKKYEGTFRCFANNITHYMLVSEMLERDYKNSFNTNKIAQPTPEQVQAVSASKLILE